MLPCVRVLLPCYCVINVTYSRMLPKYFATNDTIWYSDTLLLVLLYAILFPCYCVTNQPARDAPCTSPEALNVLDLQGTFRGLLGDQQKN